MIDKELREILKLIYDHEHTLSIDESEFLIKALVVKSLGKDREIASKYHERPNFNSHNPCGIDVVKIKEHEGFIRNEGYNQHRAQMKEKWG